jgi:hypothetical protein
VSSLKIAYDWTGHPPSSSGAVQLKVIDVLVTADILIGLKADGTVHMMKKDGLDA